MAGSMLIEVSGGVTAENFAAALIGLGVPEGGISDVIRGVLEDTCLLDVHSHLEFIPGDLPAHNLHLNPLQKLDSLSMKDAQAVLAQALQKSGVKGPYASFAEKAMAIIGASLPQEMALPPRSISLPVIGLAHTPYQDQAPYQPRSVNEGDGLFYIEVDSRYSAGLKGLDSFSHIYVLSYLDQSNLPEIMVTPPWKDSADQYGVFATRSPNRPGPIGLTRTSISYLDGPRVYTGPLDLFDGTPVLDIKPYIKTLDSMEDLDPANDGWLEGSDHLELHRLGLPHHHPTPTIYRNHLGLAAALIGGIAWGMQYLELDLASIYYLAPIQTGFDPQFEGHTRSILESNQIRFQPASNIQGGSTPAGAAVLAALSPVIREKPERSGSSGRTGRGLSEQAADDRDFSCVVTLSLTE